MDKLHKKQTDWKVFIIVDQGEILSWILVVK